MQENELDRSLDTVPKVSKDVPNEPHRSEPWTPYSSVTVPVDSLFFPSPLTTNTRRVGSLSFRCTVRSFWNMTDRLRAGWTEMRNASALEGESEVQWHQRCESEASYPTIAQASWSKSPLAKP